MWKLGNYNLMRQAISPIWGEAFGHERAWTAADLPYSHEGWSIIVAWVLP